jgi:hypothetical protein
MIEYDRVALNLIATALDRNVYDRVAHIETVHDV